MADLVEVLARAIAHACGSKMAMRRDGETHTVAMMCGFGWEGDGAHLDKYVEKNWQRFDGAAQAALSALEAAGYRVVPVEPTPEMKACGHDFGWSGVIEGCHEKEGEWAAAPKVDSPAAEQEYTVITG